MSAEGTGRPLAQQATSRHSWSVPHLLIPPPGHTLALPHLDLPMATSCVPVPSPNQQEASVHNEAALRTSQHLCALPHCTVKPRGITGHPPGGWPLRCPPTRGRGSRIPGGNLQWGLGAALLLPKSLALTVLSTQEEPPSILEDSSGKAPPLSCLHLPSHSGKLTQYPESCILLSSPSHTLHEKKKYARFNQRESTH